MTQPSFRYPALLRTGEPAPLQPSDIEQLTDADIHHVLDGDFPGHGGHRHGTGRIGQTEFPAGWDEAVVRTTVERALWSPAETRTVQRTTSGVSIRVLIEGLVLCLPLTDFETTWLLMTAYPLSGHGVFTTTRRGRRQVPLRVEDMNRILDS